MILNHSIVNSAKALIGKITYKFGADDISNGYGDCSSFTEYVYNNHGVDIGRNTEEQYNNTTHVSLADGKAGDLIFFKNTWDTPSGHIDGVEHVGILVNQNEFIHLSENGCIGSTLNNYWKEHFLAVGQVEGVNYTNIEETLDLTDTTNSVSSAVKSSLPKNILKGSLIIIVLVLMLIFLGLSVGISPKNPMKEVIKSE